jgi:hypothetical protein
MSKAARRRYLQEERARKERRAEDQQISLDVVTEEAAMHENKDAEHQAFLLSLGAYPPIPDEESTDDFIYRKGYEGSKMLAAETHDYIHCPCWRCRQFRTANGIEWPPVAGPYDDQWPG